MNMIQHHPHNYPNNHDFRLYLHPIKRLHPAHHQRHLFLHRAYLAVAGLAALISSFSLFNFTTSVQCLQLISTEPLMSAKIMSKRVGAPATLTTTRRFSGQSVQFPCGPIRAPSFSTAVGDTSNEMEAAKTATTTQHNWQAASHRRNWQRKERVVAAGQRYSTQLAWEFNSSRLLFMQNQRFDPNPRIQLAVADEYDFRFASQPNKSIKRFQNHLFIFQLQLADSGVYTCRTVPRGTSKPSTLVIYHLVVTDKPLQIQYSSQKIIKISATNPIKLQQRFQLNCSVLLPYLIRTANESKKSYSAANSISRYSDLVQLDWFRNGKTRLANRDSFKHRRIRIRRSNQILSVSSLNVSWKNFAFGQRHKFAPTPTASSCVIHTSIKSEYCVEHQVQLDVLNADQLDGVGWFECRAFRLTQIHNRKRHEKAHSRSSSDVIGVRRELLDWARIWLTIWPDSLPSHAELQTAIRSGVTRATKPNLQNDGGLFKKLQFSAFSSSGSPSPGTHTHQVPPPYPPRSQSTFPQQFRKHSGLVKLRPPPPPVIPSNEIIYLNTAGGGDTENPQSSSTSLFKSSQVQIILPNPSNHRPERSLPSSTTSSSSNSASASLFALSCLFCRTFAVLFV